MEPDFWIAKWQRQETGFHLPQPHPLLCKFATDIFTPTETIFVPLCGKTHDLSYLSEQGYAVVGNELSELAVKHFFSERKMNPEIVTMGDFGFYRDGNISIYQGDYFKLTAAELSDCKAIYDRAALIALPTEMRKNYVAKMQQLIPSAKLLLVTLEYPQAEMIGPPFSVAESEVEFLFHFAEIEKLSEKNILEKEPKFKSRGLTGLKECAYIIRW